jgi:hypothetical protein
MGYLSVLAAAAAGWIFGAVWYTVLSKPWLAVSGVKVGPDGKPQGTFSPTPFILSALAMIVVAGFMRHIFTTSGVGTPGAGALSGLGIGLFFIAPWTMINNAYPGRHFMLTVIDSGYAVIGCALMGLILTLV